MKEKTPSYYKEKYKIYIIILVYVDLHIHVYEYLQIKILIQKQIITAFSLKCKSEPKTGKKLMQEK